MSQNKLIRIAERQRDHAHRDRWFVGLMAMLIAFFILAVGSSSTNLVSHARAPTVQPRTIQEMIDTSVTACEDVLVPVVAHAPSSRPTC